jgi:hypothetical protein
MLNRKLDVARSAVANIVVLPKRVARLNRLREQDRAEARLWCEGLGNPRYCMLEYAEADEDLGDFILISGVDEAWATWGVARRGDTILLWRSIGGETIGSFETMALALKALPG